ncbi:MAG: phosphoadenosine phosphosulfate reductase family protein [Geodermatophilaceae bacterium]
MTENRFDAAFGGARRDEEKARAKERVFSFRDEFGQWDPKIQRPELWSLYNGRHHAGEHIRVFPLSNWTESDIWQYIEHAEVPLPPIYFAHQRECFRRGDMWMAVGPWTSPRSARACRDGDGALPDGRRHDGDRGGGVHRDRGRRHHRGGHRISADRARRHPGRRPHQRGVDGRPQAGRVLLRWNSSGWPPPAPSTTGRAR